MNALYNIRHKSKIAFLLLLLICLEVFNNFSHKKNIDEMETTFTSVYQDRLLALDYLFKLEEKIYRRKLAFIEGNFNTKSSINDKLNEWEIIKKYEETKLTENERKIMNEFRKELIATFSFEQNIMSSKEEKKRHNLLQHHENSTNTLLSQLRLLSDIQVSEAKHLNEASQKTVKFSYVLNQFNWALIIIIGITIQAFIFASISAIPKLPQNEHLN